MANAVVEYGEALYYPHVRFRSREWLRTSVLYHNKIWRIVPPGLSDHDLEQGYGLPDHRILEEMRILRNEHIIQNELVSPVVAKVGADFTEFVKANLTDPTRRKKLIPELSADQQHKYYRIHPGKLDRGLRDLLHELHIEGDARGLVEAKDQCAKCTSLSIHYTHQGGAVKRIFLRMKAGRGRRHTPGAKARRGSVGVRGPSLKAWGT